MQELRFDDGYIMMPYLGEDLMNDRFLFTETISKNDGLLLDDFKAWFKGYDLSEPMAIIQFTKFRY